jgi:hypothetical protein
MFSFLNDAVSFLRRYWGVLLPAVFLLVFAGAWYSHLAVAAPVKPQIAPPDMVLAAADLPGPVGEADFLRQTAPTPQRLVTVTSPGTDWEPVADKVFDAIFLTVFIWLVRPLVLRGSEWLGQRAAAEEITTDEKMSAVSKALSSQALDWALGQLGYSRNDLRDVRIRNAALSMGVEFIRKQWPQVWEWVDQNKNGQIDWLESHVAGTIPVVDHSLTARAQASAPATPAA